MYPIRLIRPTNRFKYDEQNQIFEVITDILENSCVITDCICDNPKRAIVRCALSASSSYACEYCEAKAVLVHDVLAKTQAETVKKRFDLKRKNLKNTIEFLKESPGTVASKEKDNKKIVELQKIVDNLDKEEENEIKFASKRKQLAWPFSTMTGLLRTNDLVRYLVNKIARKENLDKDEKKGFKGVSHFLSIENFNFIDCICAEYMHSVCLGTVRRLIELTFDVGELRTKTSTRKLTEANKFNSLIKTVQVFREFSRRCRNLDVGIIKAQEYRNFILFFFPLIVECIDDEYPKEKIVWLTLAYMIRACVIPNIEFECINVLSIKKACAKFYALFEKCFGKKNCTYSIHIIASHLMRIRGKHPLTARSAFKFENFYSEMKNLFQPGTRAPLKQILQNTFMKRTLEHHSCSKSIKYSCVKVPNSGMENNSMVYVFNEEKKIRIFQHNKHQ